MQKTGPVNNQRCMKLLNRFHKLFSDVRDFCTPRNDFLRARCYSRPLRSIYRVTHILHDARKINRSSDSVLRSIYAFADFRTYSHDAGIARIKLRKWEQIGRLDFALRAKRSQRLSVRSVPLVVAHVAYLLIIVLENYLSESWTRADVNCGVSPAIHAAGRWRRLHRRKCSTSRHYYRLEARSWPRPVNYSPRQDQTVPSFHKTRSTFPTSGIARTCRNSVTRS